jgi:MFS transporter, DHA1 family, solute carrier family 18 (vesicular amine transporter), member 1/2
VHIVSVVVNGRAERERSGSSRGTVAVVASCLFIDYALYGIFFPLAAHSPAELHREEQFALLYGAYAFSVLLVTPLFSYLGDRIGCRATMVTGLALAALAALAFAVGSNLFILVVARLLQGAASAALWTSGLALIAQTYVDRRVEMLGYAFTGGTLGSVLGPIAGAVLFQAAGYQRPFVVAGIVILLAGALVFLVLPRETGHKEKVDVRLLLLNKSVLGPAFAVALAAFSVGVIEPLLPVQLTRHGVTSMTVGVIFTISTLVYGLSAPIVGRVTDRVPIQRVIVGGTIAMAITLPLLAIFRGTVLVCIVLALVNVSFAFMLNPASAELGNAVDRAGMTCYSAVYGVYNICYSIGMLGTAALASAASRRLSFRSVLFCASAVLVFSIPLLNRTGLPPLASLSSTRE